MRIDPIDDLAVHLDQTPVGIVGEAVVPCCSRQTLHGLVVETEVQDRVHHPGHRYRGTGAHGHEQRIPSGTKALAGLLLKGDQMPFHFFGEPVR